MRPGLGAGITAVLALVALLVLAREPALLRVSPAGTPPAAAAPAQAAPTPIAPAEPVRDIFQFADSEAPAIEPEQPELAAEVEDASLDEAPAAEPERVRLVGVLRRGSGLLAALSVDGEVVLVAAGQSASGVTVVAVEEDLVRLQLPDGSERTLAVVEEDQTDGDAAR
jgi:hypothetical protein